MSMSHHQSMEEVEAQRRLVDQIMGKASTEFSEGRLNRNDEGDLALAVAHDPQNNVVLIHFGKPVAWVGLNRKQTEGLISMLQDHASQIK